MNRSFKRLATISAMLVCGLSVAACGTSGPAAESGANSAPGITSNQITIGLATSLTGVEASSFIGGWQGAQARFDEQNAAGGVDGRKIKLIIGDDASSATTAKSSVSTLTQVDNAFSLIFISDFTFGGAPVAQRLGVPVILGDGPDGGVQPYTNMIQVTGDSNSLSINGYSETLKELQALGAKRLALVALSYPGIPQDIASVAGAAPQYGMKVVYTNTSLPIGTLDESVPALAIKNANANAVDTIQVTASDIALLNAIHEVGIKPAILGGTEYSQSLLSDAQAVSEGQGLVMATTQRPNEENTPEITLENAALKKYEHYTGPAAINWALGWMSADLTIKGLELAGANPTRAKFLGDIRNLKGYTAEGLFPIAANYSLKDFGKNPTRQCSFYVQLQGHKFVPLNGGNAICGDILGSTANTYSN